MGQLLDRIQKPNDIKRIPRRLYPALAQEIRDFLLENVSRTGGHLASNLGAVELTMALHTCLTFPEDKLIFDVGHQSYVHKLLTGRKEGFSTLRKRGGMCGFPKRKESECDCFGTGHSSTSISAAVGFAVARDLKKTKETIVAVIGDGALSGGMAYEALNNLAHFKEEKKNLIVILNDNKMSISENVGGMSQYLNDLRLHKSYGEFKENVENALKNIPGLGESMARTLKRSKDSIKQLVVPGMLFENMGITYYGPVDGHNVTSLIHAIDHGKEAKGPVLIHVLTKKGKGYGIAENNPERFHGVSPFALDTGKSLQTKKRETYTDVFSRTLMKLARRRRELVAVTAAMPSGTGLLPFKKAYPDRFFDVGIAEEHGVTFAAGMAAAGMRPVVAIYSSFLQRAYDQVLHDVCIQNLPVFFCVDRAGLVGADGETHQGIFDLSYLGHLPNMTVMAPKNALEMEKMMEFALNHDGPIAMRYPRGAAYTGLSRHQSALEYGKGEWIKKGEQVVVLSVGNAAQQCEEAVALLEKEGICAGFVNVRFVRPLDETLLSEAARTYPLIVTVEENELAGGYGQMVSAFLHKKGYRNDLLSFGIPDCFVEHGDVAWQRKQAGIDGTSIAREIAKKVKGI
ncbi:MAG: 1-deoxy-D-xylulose-5-phosphate synthase [Eubacteriales bacterium]|nr:1-deoxy-D-xylulose-5-phosphate synthase [Eubacteriales bacterium]